MGNCLYQHPVFQKVTQGHWHPGGKDLTIEGIKHCHFPPCAEILDIGCGLGAALSLLSSLGYFPTGLDQTNQLKVNFPFIQADASCIPLPDFTFDGILCECVFSLIPNKKKAAQEFYRILRPGSVLLLSDIYKIFSCGSLENPVLAKEEKEGSSCIDGAESRLETEKYFQNAGFILRSFEDHSQALKELTAQLLWHGGEDMKNILFGCQDMSSSSCMPAACPSRTLTRKFSYGMWIFEKR